MIESIDLGFLIAKVMRVYSMPFAAVMDLPMRVFWHLQACTGRLLDEERRDALEIAARSQNSESAHELHVQLEKATPSPVKYTVEALIEASSVADPGGIETLRSLS